MSNRAVLVWGGLAIWYRWISVAVTGGGHRDFLGGIRLASHR